MLKKAGVGKRLQLRKAVLKAGPYSAKPQVLTIGFYDIRSLNDLWRQYLETRLARIDDEIESLIEGLGSKESKKKLKTLIGK